MYSTPTKKSTSTPQSILTAFNQSHDARAPSSSSSSTNTTTRPSSLQPPPTTEDGAISTIMRLGKTSKHLPLQNDISLLLYRLAPASLNPCKQSTDNDGSSSTQLFELQLRKGTNVLMALPIGRLLFKGEPTGWIVVCDWQSFFALRADGVAGEEHAVVEGLLGKSCVWGGGEEKVFGEGEKEGLKAVWLGGAEAVEGEGRERVVYKMLGCVKSWASKVME